MTIDDTTQSGANADGKVEDKAVIKPKDETSLSQILEDKPKTVGLDKFLEVKKQNKEKDKIIAALQKSVDQGATKVELSDELAALAKKFEVNEDFLKELGKTFQKQLPKNEVKEDEEDEEDEVTASEIRDDRFSKHYDLIIKDLPEFKEIANKKTIKKLSMDPENRDKTLTEILEDTYGGAIKGRSTLNDTKPGGGKEAETLDVAKARKDPEYFKKVMADPRLKAEYNANLLKTYK